MDNSGMARMQRLKSMTLRLTVEEADLRDRLADHLGVDGSGVLRQALRKLALAEGIPISNATKQQTAPNRLGLLP